MEELAGLGAEVRIAACDVADRGQLRELLDSIPPDRPLGAVLHAAAVFDNSLVEAMSEGQLERVLEAKAGAAWNLHELTRDSGLTELVLFSSIAGTFNNPGQGNYAAANAFLDALAQRRRAEGLPARSIAWGPWEQEGGGPGQSLREADLARLARAGFLPIAPAQGLELFERVRGLGGPGAVAAPLDLAALRALARVGELSPLHSGIIRRLPDRETQVGGTLAERLGAATEAERERIALALVGEQAAAILGHASPAAIDPRAAFRDLGFDSLGAVELRNRLAEASGLKLPSTLLFDHPTPAAVAAFMRRQAEGAGGAGRAAVAAVAGTEPVAIVGIGCHYPGGVHSADDLWRLVAAGVEAVSDFPEDRNWDLAALYDPDPASRGTSYVRRASFLDDVAGFDAEFFGIGPREALAMDPQQRLLLEAAWEALEDAGIDPDSVRGSATGVFAGAGLAGYNSSATHSEELTGHYLTGDAPSVLSGRIAYSLGLEGPAVTVDTACSSSLVAMHLAAAALRTGECDLALAGGVTILSDPALFVELSRQRALSPDGRCKAFAAAADGAGWAEGAGLVLLERLSDAQRNGHEVLAVIRGSATNQDGASNGLSAPNGPSQEKVIRQALANAGLDPGEVDAVEAHGTGTTLGDPIEAQALLATYGQERGEAAPLRLGSIKSNLGHTQAAAGVAGVIKMTMAMREGLLPKTLHLDAPTPHVDWDSGAVELLAEARALAAQRPPAPGRRLLLRDLRHQRPPDPRGAARAGAPAGGGSRAQGRARRPRRDPAAALGQRARGAARPGRAPPLPPPRRTPSSTPPTSASRSPPPAPPSSTAPPRSGPTGRSCWRRSRRWRPGARTRGSSPAARTAAGSPSSSPARARSGRGWRWSCSAAPPPSPREIEACASALDPFLDFSLEAVLRGEEGAPSLERVDVVQPALFATMVSLARLWQAHGVEPQALLGHSQGEIAAAHLAGALSLEDAARVVALRSQALTRLAGAGGMVSLALPARRCWSGSSPGASASRSPPSTAPRRPSSAASRRACASCWRPARPTAVRARAIAVDYASHSAQVEAIRERLLSDLAPIEPRPAAIPFYSAMSAGPLDGEELGPEYWYRSLREPVRFEPAVRALIDDGFGVFVESSPHPVLTLAVQETAEAGDGEQAPVATVGSLRRGEGGPARFVTALAEAHAHGAAVEWRRLFPGARRVHLPTYAFQRKPYWNQPSPGAADPGRQRPERRRPPPARRGDLAAGRRRRGRWLAADRPPLAANPSLAGRPPGPRRPRSSPPPPSSRWR